MPSGPDLYAILGLSRDATPTQVRRMFLKLSKRWHPDMPGGQEEKFKEIEAAYRVLSDADERAYYDHHGTARVKEDHNENAQLYDCLGEVATHAISTLESINTDSLIDEMLVHIRKELAGLRKEIHNGRELIKLITAAQKRIRRRGDGENVLRSILDARIQMIQQKVDHGVKIEAVFDQAVVFLKDYAYDADLMIQTAYKDPVYPDSRADQYQQAFAGLKWKP